MDSIYVFGFVMCGSRINFHKVVHNFEYLQSIRLLRKVKNHHRVLVFAESKLFIIWNDCDHGMIRGIVKLVYNYAIPPNEDEVLKLVRMSLLKLNNELARSMYLNEQADKSHVSKKLKPSRVSNYSSFVVLKSASI